jgi:hypothetical protein
VYQRLLTCQAVAPLRRLLAATLLLLLLAPLV